MSNMTLRVNPNLAKAITSAQIAVECGEAIRYVVADNVLDVETDQGWSQWWPWDPEPDSCL